ncbi:MAG: hypothetical protein OSB69_04525 [Alphaproteobacteria bacterium]|nr:hypothetical protein [Alphaproteobacteria bacterium]
MREFKGAEADPDPRKIDPSDQARVIKSKPYVKKRSVIKGIANIHLYATKISGPAALAVIFLREWRWVFRLEGMIALALVTAVTCDITFLGFFELTPTPSVNTLYFAPAYLFSLLLS